MALDVMNNSRLSMTYATLGHEFKALVSMNCSRIWLT